MSNVIDIAKFINKSDNNGVKFSTDVKYVDSVKQNLDARLAGDLSVLDNVVTIIRARLNNIKSKVFNFTVFTCRSSLTSYNIDIYLSPLHDDITKLEIESELIVVKERIGDKHVMDGFDFNIGFIAPNSKEYILESGAWNVSNILRILYEPILNVYSDFIDISGCRVRAGFLQDGCVRIDHVLKSDKVIPTEILNKILVNLSVRYSLNKKIVLDSYFGMVTGISCENIWEVNDGDVCKINDYDLSKKSVVCVDEGDHYTTYLCLVYNPTNLIGNVRIETQLESK